MGSALPQAPRDDETGAGGEGLPPEPARAPRAALPPIQLAPEHGDHPSAHLERLTGTHVYAGIPESGKTALAIVHARSVARRTGWPILAIDPMRVENFEDEREWRRVETVEEIAASVWKEGKHTVFTPHDDDEADHVFGVVAAGRNVVLVVDEVHTYLSPHYLSPQLGELLRGHRHFNVRNHVTTQRIGDVPQRAFGQAPRIFVFRNVARSDLKRIESDYSIPEHVTATIPQFHFIEIYQGFE